MQLIYCEYLSSLLRSYFGILCPTLSLYPPKPRYVSSNLVSVLGSWQVCSNYSLITNRKRGWRSQVTGAWNSIMPPILNWWRPIAKVLDVGHHVLTEALEETESTNMSKAEQFGWSEDCNPRVLLTQYPFFSLRSSGPGLWPQNSRVPSEHCWESSMSEDLSSAMDFIRPCTGIQVCVLIPSFAAWLSSTANKLEPPTFASQPSHPEHILPSCFLFPNSLPHPWLRHTATHTTHSSSFYSQNGTGLAAFPATHYTPSDF